MSDLIAVNVTSVNNILQKMLLLQEEMRILFSDTEKAILNAELEGWNDKNYHIFLESFIDTKSTFINLERRIDEEHIPYLRKIIRNSAEFI